MQACLGHFLNFFIHDSIKSREELYKKQSFFLISSLMTLFFSCLYIGLCLFIEYPAAIYTIYFFVISHFILFFMMKNKVSLDLIGNLYALMTMIGFAVITLTSGGVASAIVAWYLCTIVSASWFVNKKSGMIWGGLVVLWLSVLIILELTGTVFPYSYNIEYKNLFSAAMNVSVFLYYMIVLYIYEDWKEISIKKEKGLTNAKQSIINIIAHDLKNPLAVLEMRIGRFNKVLNDEAYKKDITSMSTSLTTINEILDGLLAMAKSGIEMSAANEVVDLVQIIKKTLKNGHYESAQKKSSKIVFNHCDRILEILGNKLALIRVINNLLTNAIKYSNGGSTIFVSLQKYSKEIHFLVQDEGLGFTSEQIEIAFERFSNISNKPTAGEDSNGIGLNITRNLVMKDLGATITLHSDGPNKGSTFTIIFSV